ncbi:MAG: hypothetical protein ACRDZ7_03350 [Acidimicrobiia bacterium]
MTPPSGGVNLVIEAGDASEGEVGMGTPGEVEMGTPEEVEMGAPAEASPEEECTIPNGLLKNLLVAASVGAGGIHLWAAWAHSGITRVLVFFIVVGALQLWLAAAVVWVRSVPWSLLIGGAVVNAAVVVVHVLSRITGVPGQPKALNMDEIMNAAIANPGPSKGFMVHSESFGLPDTTASLLEIAVVVAVVLLVRARRRSSRLESGIDETVDVGTGVA